MHILLTQLLYARKFLRAAKKALQRSFPGKHSRLHSRSSCILDETLSGESMAIHVINKVNSRLRFLYRQNKFLDIPLRRLLCNAMIQPFFDYACNVWYPNLSKNFRKRLQQL